MTLDAALALETQGAYEEAETKVRERLAGSPSDTVAIAALQRLLELQGRAPVPSGAEARVALARRLAALRGPAALHGRDEGPRLEQAADILEAMLGEIPPAARPAAASVLWRAGRYAAAEALGELADLGRFSAQGGELSLDQIARAVSPAERSDLMRQHRAWAAALEARATARPLSPRPGRRADGRLRLGFLSSDLRHHVVGYFAQPVFQFIDQRFELYVYSSYPGPPDPVRPWFEQRATQYRFLPPDDRDAAEVVAGDDLDLLLDLGGPTQYNRPGILAWKPAPRQAAWLGYPHSLGLAAVDYMILDPLLAPRRPGLILETPLLMPSGWVCMAPAAFPPEPSVALQAPVERNGWITFGTANDPYKFSPDVWRTWAQVLAKAPESRFLVVRPEAGAASFQAAARAFFAEAGVEAQRLEFRPERGTARQAYAEIDIALDTFPVTGGTTTCEAAWMGAPTVTLVGEGVHERLSWSILGHLGLAELAANTRDDYVRIACDLAAFPARVGELRRTMRDRIRARPFGQPMQFAADFYELMAMTITGGQAR